LAQGSELSVQQIGVFVQLFSHLSVFPVTADLGKQIILLHNAQNRFGIPVNTPLLQPDMYSAVAISSSAGLLAFRNQYS
jgi:hypothetical protein